MVTLMLVGLVFAAGSGGGLIQGVFLTIGIVFAVLGLLMVAGGAAAG